MIAWEWTMCKPQVPLAQGLHAIGIPLARQFFGYSMDIPIKHVNGDIYFGKEEIRDITAHIAKRIAEDPAYPDEIEERIHNAEKQLVETKERLNAIDPKTLSDEELLATFFEGYISIGNMTAFMSFKGSVQISDVLQKLVRRIIESRLKNAEEVEDAFLLLSLPSTDSFMARAYENLLRAASDSTLLEEHAKRFGWTGCIMYTGLPLTAKDFEDTCSGIDNPKELLEQMHANKKAQEGKLRAMIEKLCLSEKEMELVRQFRTWTHLRTYIKDMTSIGMEPTVRFLQEIAKRTEYSYKDLLYLDYEELKKVFLTPCMKSTSKDRQPAWGCVIINGKIKYYTHKNLNRIREKSQEFSHGVKGMSACHGLVQGPARIVLSIADLGNVKEGDILITHMTTTNFVPTLAKVSAIVTDEGGITCHAAIISRELSIPCVIGTRIATKAFRNGEMLEVDAKKGFVRKIR